MRRAPAAASPAGSWAALRRKFPTGTRQLRRCSWRRSECRRSWCSAGATTHGVRSVDPMSRGRAVRATPKSKSWKRRRRITSSWWTRKAALGRSSFDRSAPSSRACLAECTACWSKPGTDGALTWGPCSPCRRGCRTTASCWKRSPSRSSRRTTSRPRSRRDYFDRGPRGGLLCRRSGGSGRRAGVGTAEVLIPDHPNASPARIIVDQAAFALSWIVLAPLYIAPMPPPLRPGGDPPVVTLFHVAPSQTHVSQSYRNPSVPPKSTMFAPSGAAAAA